MPKVTEAYREARRDQIIDAAIACFIRNGIHATTMTDVIAESGLSAGAIYVYFGGKQELALAAVRREGAGRSSGIDAASLDGPISPANLLRALDADFARQPRTRTIVIQLWSEAATDPEYAEVATSAFAALGSTLSAPLTKWAQQSRDMGPDAALQWAEKIMPAMLALLQGLVLQQTIAPGFDKEHFLAGVDLLFS
ncbi:TetR/AcrR family transcriptional regulator [Leifsonia sp. McL0607]|uniref:TetR/AcrR family transcriptional regulator n=1 Tax=Leifsonia sp. McL0607 TaxID=3415672 RepID=UPI003CF19F1C